MDHLVFADSEARGRNGYFRAVTADVYVHRDKIHVDIMSRRAVWLAPVCLELSFPDAAALARSLTGQVQGRGLTNKPNEGNSQTPSAESSEIAEFIIGPVGWWPEDGQAALPSARH